MKWYQNKRLISAIIFCTFSVLGFFFAGYLVSMESGAVSSEFCSISETVNCSTVSQSKYAQVAGIPVPVLGLIGYVLMFVGMIWHYKKKDENVLTILGAFVLVSLAFSLYLTAVEAFILKAWCILCIGSQISVLFMVGSFFYYRSLPESQVKGSKKE